MSGVIAAAGVAIFDAHGELLLGRHAHDGRWATFGGAVEPGESASEAAVREVREEIGISVAGTEFIGSFGGSPIYEVRYADGSFVTYEVTMYGCVIGRHTTAVPDGVEILESCWFRAHELDEALLAIDMAEIVPAAFEWFEAKRNAGG